MLFTMLQRITLHKKLHNKFAYATANSFRWSLIGPLNIEVQIAGKMVFYLSFTTWGKVILGPLTCLHV